MLGLFRKRDIAAGDMLFGEYIALGRILRAEGMNDIERTKAIVKTLHNKDVSDTIALLLIPYGLQVAEGYIAWQEKENQECHVPPRPEATQAGIDQLAKEVGDMATVVQFAERFGRTFEQVYNMPYLEVFAIWKVDAATARYQRRLDAVLKSKKDK